MLSEDVPARVGATRWYGVTDAVSELAPESETVIAFVVDAFVTAAARLDVPASDAVMRAYGVTVAASEDVPASVTVKRCNGTTVAESVEPPASATEIR